jgi:hypothetical protein
MKRELDLPHGYCEDADGHVCFIFQGFRTGTTHRFPDVTANFVTTDDPSTLPDQFHWKYADLRDAPVNISVNDTEIKNDGTDSVLVTLSLDSAAESSRAATFTVGGDSYQLTLAPDTDRTETLTTTAAAGTTIALAVSGPDIDGDTATVEVIA